MNYSFDDILFKDFCSNPFIRQWILENRYVTDGVFKCSFYECLFWSYKENKGFIKIRKKIPLIYWTK